MTTILPFISGKSIALIGLMGAGKSSIGRRLAETLNLEFVDTDDEIVKAAGCSIPDIFDIYGEPTFRDLEKRVIKRLLGQSGQVIATGGGAYMNADIRTRINENAVTVWLRAELDILVERTGRRNGRPLLKQGNPGEILKSLMDQRHPVYGEADIVIDTGVDGHDITVQRIVTALKTFAKASST